MSEPAAQPRSPFPFSFYVANVMEVFERMAWYGFFAVSSLYITSPVTEGGLGFSSMQRGVLQGTIPFLLYLFPVLTGALADRYGYKKTFLAAFAIMTPAYLLLGQANRVHELTGLPSFPIFFLFFLLVALGAATFKPVVVGTVGRTTDDTNRGLGFGVFYTIVNIGGFVGPIVAGYVRAVSWDFVFVMSAVWIALNFIPTLFLYKEPVPKGGDVSEKRSIIDVLKGAQDVLGNGRFALIVIPILLVTMVAGGGWFSQILQGQGVLPEDMGTLAMAGVDWAIVAAFGTFWGVVNVAWNLVVPKGDADRPWYAQRSRIGNWPFVLYLLILAGFWASFNQIFITLPEYIRDYVDTTGLVNLARMLGPWAVDFLASVNVDSLTLTVAELVHEYGVLEVGDATREVFFHLVHVKVHVPESEIASAFTQLAAVGVGYHHEVEAVASAWVGAYSGGAEVDVHTFALELGRLAHSWAIAEDPAVALATAQSAVEAAGLSVPPDVVSAELSRLAGVGTPYYAESATIASAWAESYRQVNPEYLINLDAGAIVVFQIGVSAVIQRWKPFPVLVAGTIVAGTGIALGSIAVTGALTVLAILVFAFGEMIASPKSQEYVARIAPPDKVALFMGYYFVSVALGNLFGGILSGVGSQVLAKDLGMPGLMWILFGGVGFLTAAALLVFNWTVVPRLEAQRQQPDAA